MTTYNISINDELDAIVKEEMKRGHYANRSEFFRDILRQRFLGERFSIEALDENDPEYSEAIQSLTSGEFLSLAQVKKQFNV